MVHLGQYFLENHFDGVLTDTLALNQLTLMGFKLGAKVLSVLVFALTVCHGDISFVEIWVLPELTNEG